MIALLMGLKTVSPDELQQLTQEHAVTTIDVNPRHGWVRARVPGAVNLDPVGYDESDLPRDKDALLVFYCSNLLCSKAPRAALRARRMGYRNVRVLGTGIAGWLGAKLPVESGEAVA